ncbi:MAG: 50S ribosomal protein L32 [Planctomycetes bacterium]|nr:50S ribosomal protein L32 [Planctomycetota bacterium]
MAVPALRTSASRRGKRRSHHALKVPHTVLCPNCGAARQPHTACPSCGYVRPGLQVKAPEGE